MRTPLTPRPRRVALALAAGALLVTATTACEPPGPLPVFTVVPAATGPDVEPGDGACETAAAVCSLQAAVEEANALDIPTDISVPDGVVAAVDLTVTGVIDLMAAGDFQELDAVRFTVAEGAKLDLTDAGIRSLVADGNVTARRVRVGELADTVAQTLDPLVEVGPNGRAMFTNGLLKGWLEPAAVNAGVLVLFGTTVGVPAPPHGHTFPMITTTVGGETRLAASAFLGSEDSVPVCDGVAPVSYGYNLAPDDTCSLTGPGDVPNVSETTWAPGDGTSARVDAIPFGELQCGTGWTDVIPNPDSRLTRPLDGDLDDVAACDIGAYEL